MPEFDRSTPVTVALSVHGGHVDITAEERVSVLAEVQPMDGGEASVQAAERTLITLEGDTLVVRAPESSGSLFRRHGKLRVTVRVPLESSLALKTASADVRAAGRFTTAQAKVASGDIQIDDVTGDATIESASGDLTVGHVGGSLRISSASGDLSIRDVTNDVDAGTASGDMKIRAIGRSLRAKTASGDIEVGVLSAGETRISSASGDVKVGVLAGTGVWLDVSTASGSTRNELSMGTDATPSTGAQLELRIRTASGDIAIRRVVATPSTAAA